MERPGELNIEVAHHLGEPHLHGLAAHARLESFLEILEAFVLALVAVATAWSGYQAARWDGHQSELYGRSSGLNTKSSGLMTLSGQERIYDTELIEKRFRDEYRVAFTSWIKENPLNNPKAPPGPIFMPEYRNAKGDEADNLAKEAAGLFEQGTEARENSDRYVRVTVFLATILLFIAISPRFRMRSVRTWLAVIASALLVVGMFNIVTLPRI